MPESDTKGPTDPKDEVLRTPRKVAEKRFESLREVLQTTIHRVVKDHMQNERIVEHTFSLFVSEAVNLMFTGLDEWLDAGARDRASAEASRKSQDEATKASIRLSKAMVALTIVIALATAWSALKPTQPIMVAAPVVPSPTVNLPATPVTLSPIINVTMPPPVPVARRPR